jgi:hypothetical protein
MSAVQTRPDELVALWRRPHLLRVRTAPGLLDRTVLQLEARTAANGCSCPALPAAIATRVMDVEVRDFFGPLDVRLAPLMERYKAVLTLGGLDVRFCPACGRSAQLYWPKVTIQEVAPVAAETAERIAEGLLRFVGRRPIKAARINRIISREGRTRRQR